ncbi:PstS family phosphate ABC transporter substrate-binding protein [Dysgonomonas macrotermitis]|uniref:Phosphate ABC transporter substrate-binding protein, PhoT family n=1 Tax=Dysgonomonas macrotermitis TaxID=1346286 RepID=A0A1M5GZS6_9BACT|nr:substrate-binding domain-containing protein [Dysgonomonas macrotermitis]SHG09155.1 phosphate ABC transporter substrate-binding protein, PhoT family [Dysgonomonas macrotermitis]
MRKVGLFCIILSLTIFSACNQRIKVTRTDTPTSGIAEIASDDCFSPIVQEEIDVFEALNKDASIIPTFASEVDVFNLLLKDSLRLIVAARDLTDAEKQGLLNRKLQPRTQKIAVDGIALIINKENTDSLISMSQIKKIMTGEIDSWKQINEQSKYDQIAVVFDNPNSSTVRFIKDSINRGEPLAERLKAQENNKAVLDYVSRTPNAIGVIGVNWVSNPTDTTNLSFTDRVRVMSVSKSDPATRQSSFQPYAAYLALGEYPLRRDVFVITSDLRGTLPAGFVGFLVGDRGQRIILKAGLIPATRPMRLITIQDEF